MQNNRPAGILLSAAALGTVLVMTHHPTSPHAATIGALVHAAMIGLLLTMTWGFLQFAFGRGISRLLVSAGLLAFAAGTIGHIAAAMMSGFVVPALAAGSPPVAHDFYRLTWHVNQAFAGLGVIATGTAYLCWSADLIRDGDGGARLTGAVGVLIGILLIGPLVAGIVHLDVGGAILIYGLQALWAVIIGVQMARGKV